MKPHFLLDLNGPILSWEYMGFAGNRTFNPCLTIEIMTKTNNKPFKGIVCKVVFEGYDLMWQLLDTVCYKETLPRSHFNDVLKHRWDEPSIDVIRGVLQEGDCTKIILQGDYIEDMFVVRIVHRPTSKDPILNEYTDIITTLDAGIPPADAVFWEPYMIQTGTSKAARELWSEDGTKRPSLFRNVGSAIGVWKIGDDFYLTIRAIYLDTKDCFGLFPLLERGDKIYSVPKAQMVPRLSLPEIYAALRSLHHEAAVWSHIIDDDTPTFSGRKNEATLSKYRRNERVLLEWMRNRL